MSRDQFLQALVGSLLGLLPLLFSAISHQLENRSITTRRDQAIDLAQRRVAFLTAWLQTRQQFDSAERLAAVKESLASEFDDIKTFVDSELIRPQAVHAARSTDRSWIQRALLLYWPRAVSGWAYHGLFYMMFSIVILFTVAQIPQGTSLIDGYFVATLPFLFLAVLFNILANRSDHIMEQRSTLVDAATK